MQFHEVLINQSHHQCKEEIKIENIKEVLRAGKNFGKNASLKNKKVIIEYTDPNPFKEFHIGHLMPNVIGSALANIFGWNGAEVKQVNYQGDVGMHVAKTLWKGDYVLGAKAFENDPEAKTEIQEKLTLKKKDIESASQKLYIIRS